MKNRIKYYSNSDLSTGWNLKKIEEVIKWFFEKYLKDEFQVKKYKINIPTESSTYVAKCRDILIEIDYIFKEYNLISFYFFSDQCMLSYLERTELL